MKEFWFFCKGYAEELRRFLFPDKKSWNRKRLFLGLFVKVPYKKVGDYKKWVYLIWFI
jgi:hypothetical protein